MSLNRLLSFTYDATTVGLVNTELATSWTLALTPETGFFKCRFIVSGSNAIATMQALEAALSVRRKLLTVVYSSTTIENFDPTTSVCTGYEAFPKLTKLDRPTSPDGPLPDNLNACTYDFEVTFRRPADANGRRDEHPATQKHVSGRPRCVFAGVWTVRPNSPGATARGQFEDASVGFEPHAVAFLAAYDNVSTWAEVVHDVTDNDTGTEVSYHCEFQAHSHGLVNETREIRTDLQGLRVCGFGGEWIDPAGVGAGSGAMAAFNDAGFGFEAQARAYLAATYPGTGWALFSATPRPNDIDKRITYSAEFWEVALATGSVVSGRRSSRVVADPMPSTRQRVEVSGVYMQTVVAGVTYTALENYLDATKGADTFVLTAVTGLLAVRFPGITFDAPTVKKYDYVEQLGILSFDWIFNEILLNQSASAANDPDIIGDQLSMASTTVGPGDSPMAQAGATITSGTVGVKRPIELRATYTAWIAKGVDPITKWTSGLQAYVQTLIRSKLGATPGALLTIEPTVDPVNNAIAAQISLRSYVSAYLEFSIDEVVARDLGLIFTPKTSGKPDDYLEQQGPTTGNKKRITRLMTTTPGAISQFQSPSSVAGYRLLRYEIGSKTIVEGIPGTVTTTIYVYELIEYFLFVAASGGASSSGGGTTTSTGGSASAETAAKPASGGGDIPDLSPRSNPGSSLDTAASPSSGGGDIPSVSNSGGVSEADATLKYFIGNAGYLDVH